MFPCGVGDPRKQELRHHENRIHHTIGESPLEVVEKTSTATWRTGASRCFLVALIETAIFGCGEVQGEAKWCGRGRGVEVGVCVRSQNISHSHGTFQIAVDLHGTECLGGRQ